MAALKIFNLPNSKSCCLVQQFYENSIKTYVGGDGQEQVETRYNYQGMLLNLVKKILVYRERLHLRFSYLHAQLEKRKRRIKIGLFALLE